MESGTARYMYPTLPGIEPHIHIHAALPIKLSTAGTSAGLHFAMPVIDFQGGPRRCPCSYCVRGRRQGAPRRVLQSRDLRLHVVLRRPLHHSLLHAAVGFSLHAGFYRAQPVRAEVIQFVVLPAIAEADIVALQTRSVLAWMRPC
jgi:hypothetical protein